MFKKLIINNSIINKNLNLKINGPLFMILASCFMIIIALQASKTLIYAQADLPEGITVIPSIKHLDLASNPSEYDIRYINNTTSDITLEIEAQDFAELDEEYRVNFLEPKDAANYKYSLSSWLTFENKNLEIPARSEKTIKVFIDDDRITKGGHHTIILARAVQVDVDQEININPIISSLLFVRAATGKEIESGVINTFRADRSFINFPESFTLRFKNDGNVHVTPYGQIVVTDIFGNRVASGILNEKSLNALPESIRKYEIPVKKEAKFLIPGIYTAKIDMHFGENKKELSRTLVFFSQGSVNLLAIGLILVITIVALTIFRKPIKKKLKKGK